LPLLEALDEDEQIGRCRLADKISENAWAIVGAKSICRVLPVLYVLDLYVLDMTI